MAMNLSDAISGVEKAETAYSNASSQTNNDMALVPAIQAKLDAANAQVAADKSAQDDAAKSFNNSLDTLIAVAMAAKIPAGVDPAQGVLIPATGVFNTGSVVTAPVTMTGGGTN